MHRRRNYLENSIKEKLRVFVGSRTIKINFCAIFITSFKEVYSKEKKIKILCKVKRPTKGSERLDTIFKVLYKSIIITYSTLHRIEINRYIHICSWHSQETKNELIDYNFLQFSIYELPKTFCDFYNLRIRRLFYTFIVFVGLLLLTIYMDCAERFKIHFHF